MNMVYVSRDRLPEGSSWVLIERDGKTTALVIDSLGERLARLALLQLKQPA